LGKAANYGCPCNVYLEVGLSFYRGINISVVGYDIIGENKEIIE
jgi:hypothetical protein